MNMFRAFMELDKINEGVSRQELIARINKATGKNYRFADEEEYPYGKLLAIATSAESKKAKADREAAKRKNEIDLAVVDEQDFAQTRVETCDFCNTQLNTIGQCPVCDLGEEDLLEWVTSSGQTVKIPTSNTNTSVSTSASTNISPYSSARTTTGKYKVAIVSDKGRLRAMGDDGIHGLAFVAFPNSLRDFEGQHYEVDQLIWNGKNYRVSGNIEEI